MPVRERPWHKVFDLAIIGGGINGCGIARDAAGRGNVRRPVRAERSRQRHLVGVDQADPWRPALSRVLRVPAGARGADRARGAVADRAAHHPAAALRAAASAGLRPAWLLRLGLFLYDYHRRPQAAAADALGRSRARRGRQAAEAGRFTRGFEYSDCWVDDARLVVLNARDAAERGADIRTRTRAVDRRRRDGDLARHARGHAQRRAQHHPRARAGQRRRPVGRAGARRRRPASTRPRKVRLVQGSHIVVPQAVRPRPRLHLPERRRPHRVRDPLSRATSR